MYCSIVIWSNDTYSSDDIGITPLSVVAVKKSKSKYFFLDKLSLILGSFQNLLLLAF